MLTRLSPVFKLLAVLCAAVIAWGSLQPVTGVPTITHADKLIHVVAYGVLAGLIGLGWRRWPLWSVVLAAALFGLSIELAQGTLSDIRTPSVADALANTLGAGLAALCLRAIFRAEPSD